MKKTTGQRMFSVVAAAMLVATNIVPNGLNVFAATDITSVEGGYITDDVTLLTGNSDLAGNDLASTISNYDSTYLLGVAADFCVFLNENMDVYDSDAEGRIAVGGDIIISVPWNSYAIGFGDYVKKTELEKLLIDREYAATIIMGGNLKSGTGFTENKGLISDGYYENGIKYEGNGIDDVENNGYLPTKRTNRKLVLNRDTTDGVDFNFIKNNSDLAEGVVGAFQKVDKTQTYVVKLFDFDVEFNKLYTRSEQLSKTNSSGHIEYGTDENGTYIKFVYDGQSTDKKECVYFELSEDEYEYYMNAKNIYFENIPELPTPRMVVNNEGYPSETEWDRSYIVVNVAAKADSNGQIHISNVDNGITDKFTYINGTNISNNGPVGNNDPGVTSILYNFYNADEFTTIVLANNFQGTVFAPKSHATDEQKLGKGSGHGHLSGALIAHCFEGYTEFGYRPFTGGVKLAATGTDYRIAVNKYDAADKVEVTADDGTVTVEAKKDATTIGGAKFGIFEAIFDDDGNITGYSDTPKKTISTSDPSDEFEDYLELNPGSYMLREIEAPAGYALTKDAYYFTVKETYYDVYLREVGGTTDDTEEGEEGTADDDTTEETTRATYNDDSVVAVVGGDLEGEAPAETDYTLKVSLPRIEVTVYKDANQTQSWAEYTYSAFRANARTYKIGDHEVKFGLFDEESMLEGLSTITVDGEEYNVNGEYAEEIKNFLDEIELVHVRDMCGGNHGEGNFSYDEDYDAYVVFYKGEPIFPVVTLTRVLVQDDTNGFDGFNFFDEKVLTINKIDTAGKLLSGATIDLYLNGTKIDNSTEEKPTVWTWDAATGQIQLKDIQTCDDGKVNIYRLHESKTPSSSYEDPTTDIIFAVMNNHLYTMEIDHNTPLTDDLSSYAPVSGDDWHDCGNIITAEKDTDDPVANRTIEIVNTKKGLTLQKVGADKQTVIGTAKVNLYHESGTLIAEDIEIGEVKLSDVLKEKASDSPYVDATGALIPGVYYLMETKQPDGYKNDWVNQPLYFKVNAEGTASEYYLGDAIEFDVATNGDSNNWYIVYNGEKLTYDWDNSKLYTIGENITKLEIIFDTAADFDLYISTSNSALSDSGLLNKQADWGKYGSYGSDQIVNGSFVFNFDSPLDFVVCKMQISGNVTVKSIKLYPETTADDETSTESPLIISPDGLILSIVNEIDGYNVGGTKVDGNGEPLAGATIGLFDPDDLENPIDTTTSGADGHFEFTGIKPGVEYVIKEIATPDDNKYLLSGEEYTLLFDSEEIKKEDILIREAEYGGVKIYKEKDLTEGDLASGQYVQKDLDEVESELETYKLGKNGGEEIDRIRLTATYWDGSDSISPVDSIIFHYTDNKEFTINRSNSEWIKDNNEWLISDITDKAINNNYQTENIDEIKVVLMKTNWNQSTTIKIQNRNGETLFNENGFEVTALQSEIAEESILGGTPTYTLGYNNDQIQKVYQSDSNERIVKEIIIHYADESQPECVLTEFDNPEKILDNIVWWTSDNKGCPVNGIDAIRVRLIPTNEPITATIRLTNQNSETLFEKTVTTSDEEIVETIVGVGGSTASKKYYKFAQPNAKGATEIACQLGAHDGFAETHTHWVELEETSPEKKETFLEYKRTFTVTKDDGQSETITLYDPLKAEGSTYTINGTQYTIDDVNQLPDGFRAIPITVDENSGYAIVCNDTIYYPDFVIEDNLLTKNLTKNFTDVSDDTGIVIVNEENTDRITTKVTLQKVDKAGELLTGASFTLTKGGVEQPFTSSDNGAIWQSGELEDGTYVIRETEAPDGYTLLGEDIEFTVTGGVVTSKNTSQSNVEWNPEGSNWIIKVTDELSEITISKKDFADKGETNANELSGAEFTLTYNGEGSFELVDYDKNAGGNYITINKTSKTITWTSTEKAAVFKGLPDGEYTLTETSAPNGYDGLTATITFTIENGVITESHLSDDESESQYVDRSGNVITVYNTKQIFSGAMPETGFGGIAQAMLQVLGFMALTASLYVLALKKRRQNNNPQTA